MPQHAAGFKEWLSGAALYRNPPQWTCRRAPVGFEIRPDFRRAIAILSVVALLVAVGGFAFVRSRPGAFPVVIILLALVPIEAAALALLVTSVKDQRKGPYLVFSVSNETVRLPREGLTFRKADVLGFRLVSGNWVGGAAWQDRRKDAVSELQLVVNTADGATAYVIVGWYRGDPMNDALREITAATSIPVEVVKQEDVATTVGSAAPDWER